MTTYCQSRKQSCHCGVECGSQPSNQRRQFSVQIDFGDDNIYDLERIKEQFGSRNNTYSVKSIHAVVKAGAVTLEASYRGNEREMAVGDELVFHDYVGADITGLTFTLKTGASLVLTWTEGARCR